MRKSIQLLDATLRDGGQGLEDAFKNDISNSYFPSNIIPRIINLISDSGVDIIELGAIEYSKEDKKKFAIYKSIEELSKTMPNIRNENQLYAGLYIGPDTSLNNIPEWNPSLVEGVRVILRYSELEKSLNYCAALSKKGYKVFIQPMLTMRYTDEELFRVINSANEMSAYALYFVDSYGYMQTNDIQRLFDFYNSRLNEDIRIGFHAHNNMSLAYSNVLNFLNIDADRMLIIDSCSTGMGQGAGNLQTELIIPYLNHKFCKQYKFDPILEICDILEELFPFDYLWGYSVTRLLPAIYNTAYKYALIMRHKYNMTFKEINHVLLNMPNDLRSRYTTENVEMLVSKYK